MDSMWLIIIGNNFVSVVVYFPMKKDADRSSSCEELVSQFLGL